MVRTQIQLTPQQSEAVKREAAEQGISMAEFIRSCIDERLRNGHKRVEGQVGQPFSHRCDRRGGCRLSGRVDDTAASPGGLFRRHHHALSGNGAGAVCYVGVLKSEIRIRTFFRIFTCDTKKCNKLSQSFS